MTQSPLIPAAAALLLAMASNPSQAALKEGDAAPEFKARAAHAGQSFDYSLAQARRAGPVVVYFYPSAFTGGCTVQAREFALHVEQFRAAGASIVGVSQDSIDRLEAFSADPGACAGKLDVASDADGAISRAFELAVRAPEAGKLDARGDEIRHGLVERTTFVVAPDGRIAATLGGLKPADNVAAALGTVQRLAGSRPAPAATSR